MEKECKRRNRCKYFRYYALHINDEPTKVASLGWRFAFALLGYIILGKSTSLDNAFFVGLILFAIPLQYEYWKFDTSTSLRSFIRGAGILFSGLWILISFLGLVGILEIQKINGILCAVINKTYISFQGRYMPLVTLWYFVIISVVLTFIDCIVYKSNYEKGYENNVMG